MANEASSGGISAAGLLGVVFVTLKIVGKIDWPWLWVLAPFWIPIAIACAFIAVMLVGLGVTWLFTK